MFTGLISEIGTVESIERGDSGARLRIVAGLGAALAPGDSVSVAGACLTAVDPAPGGFAADVMNQTLELTALGRLAPGSAVNLEPAVRASDRLGGHIVQGHVDATGTVVGVAEDGFARRVRIELPAGLETGAEPGSDPQPRSGVAALDRLDRSDLADQAREHLTTPATGRARACPRRSAPS